MLTAAAYHPIGPGEVELALSCAEGTPPAHLTRGIRPALRVAVTVFKTAVAVSDTR